jgi:hypothetical protein
MPCAGCERLWLILRLPEAFALIPCSKVKRRCALVRLHPRWQGVATLATELRAPIMVGFSTLKVLLYIFERAIKAMQQNASTLIRVRSLCQACERGTVAVEEMPSPSGWCLLFGHNTPHRLSSYLHDIGHALASFRQLESSNENYGGSTHITDTHTQEKVYH